MPCDISTYCTAIVDLAQYSSLVSDESHFPKLRDVERVESVKQRRSGPSGDQSNSKGHRHKFRSRIIPDSTQIDPEYVWGDEGPIND